MTSSAAHVVMALEAELLQLRNSAINDPTRADSTTWRTGISGTLDELRSLERERGLLEPPSKWSRYHQVHLEYIQLDIKGYLLLYDGLAELNEGKLLDANNTFQALLAKRDELLRLVTDGELTH